MLLPDKFSAFNSNIIEDHDIRVELCNYWLAHYNMTLKFCHDSLQLKTLEFEMNAYKFYD